MRVDDTTAILDCVPINQAAIAGVANDDAEPLVFLEAVFEQAARDRLVEQLPQAQSEARVEIFLDDGVRLLDHRERSALRPVGDEDLGAHRPPAAAEMAS